jgi:hypothetical protein
MSEQETEWQSVDEIPKEVRVISERPEATGGAVTPVITMESLQRYVEDERSRNRQALMWASTLFLFIVLLVLVMFLSVGIYVLRRTRETSTMVVNVRQQNKKQTSAITHIVGKLDQVASLQAEVKDAVTVTEERRAQNAEDVRKNLERFGKWVASGKSNDKRTIAVMEERLRQIEEAKKKNAEEFAAMRDQYVKMQASLDAMVKARELVADGNVMADASLDSTRDDTEKTSAIAGAVADVEKLAAAGENEDVKSGDLSEDWLDGALASAEDLMVSETVSQEEQSSRSEISVVTFPNGDRYEGGFDKGLFSGWGVYYYHNGDRYEGEFDSDMKSGRGTFTFSNGDKYVGKFKDDMMDGYGSFSYMNGDRYVGEFKNDMRGGKGTMIYKNGNKYSGGFKNGEKSGNGVFRFSNGDVYKGEFSNDARNGSGTYSYAGGSKYIGQFVDGRRQGKGRYIYEGGEEYIGDFKNGRKEGRGVCVYPNGTRLKGVWNNDKFIRQIK